MVGRAREKGLVNAGTSFCAHKSAEISKKDKKQKEKEKKQREKEKKQREKEKKKNEMELRKKNTIVENKNFPKQCKTLMPDKNKESSEKKFSAKTIALLGIELIPILKFIHDKHIIHRDIKPDNFAIGYDDPCQIYILDFGLAKKYRSSKTLEQYPYIKKKKLTP